MESTLSDGMEPKNVCVCVCVVCLCVRINSYTYLVKWDGAEEIQKKPRSEIVYRYLPDVCNEDPFIGVARHKVQDDVGAE